MMRRSVIIAVATAAVLAAGASVLPALAATSDPSGTCPITGREVGAQAQPGRGTGPGGYGMANGMGSGMANGMGSGMGVRRGSVGDPLAGPAQGTLTAAQKQSLAGMAEEEKLAHDVYVELASRTSDPRFTRISGAETRHLAEVRALLPRYGVTDPTADKANGIFATAAVQQQYTQFVTRGTASLTAALAVGRDVEKDDLARLANARSGVTASDVLAVYDHLTRGSQRHLQAFGG